MFVFLRRLHNTSGTVFVVGKSPSGLFTCGFEWDLGRMDTCKACSRNFARSDRSVLCSGSCGRVFHPGCVGLNATNFKSWSANVGLLWFCENCRVNFNPSVMDREAVIIKTLRDVLLRMDSMDLRVGQFGENLKALNNLLSPHSTFVRRDSNFSSRLQRLAMSGPSVYDPTDFYNSIDRFNFDLSLRSNVANNTIVDADDELDVSLDNDDNHDNREMNITPRRADISLPSTSAGGMNSTVNDQPAIVNSVAIVPNTTTTSVPVTATVPVVNAPTATTASTAATATAPCSTSATNRDVAVNVPHTATSAQASAAISTTSYAAITSSAAVVQNRVPINNGPANVPRTTVRASNHTHRPAYNGLQDCRLRVVSRSRPSVREISNEEATKSFYITPFHIDQSEEDIIEYLRETINIDNSSVKCAKLVPRNKNINELSFISFKLSVSQDLVSIINDPFYWPDGVEIREFQPKNGNLPNLIAST